jgi:hypothetical protein
MLQAFLKDNRDIILEKWIDLTFQTYSSEMVRFLKREKNQFSNPVRNTIITSLQKVYDGILNNMNLELCLQGLEEIIKLRAIQDFSPSEALSFMFKLKNIVRDEFLKDRSDLILSNEMITFEENLEKLIGISINLYLQSREKVYEIRIKEIKSQARMAFSMMEEQNNDLCETSNCEVCK